MMSGPYARSGKRALDIVVAVALLVVLSPVLLVIALAIVADDPGPPLFRQTRVGRDRKAFRIVKFRSMRSVKAGDEVQASTAASAYSGRDPRITRVGRLIRATSLDELPQLLNILDGSMSLVGPRPVIPAQLSAIRPDQQGRFRARPGITGLAQVSGRRSLAWPDQLALDARYADSVTLLADLRIVIKTIGVVFAASDVYGNADNNWRNFIIDDDRMGP